MIPFRWSGPLWALTFRRRNGLGRLDSETFTAGYVLNAAMICISPKRDLIGAIVCELACVHLHLV